MKHCHNTQLYANTENILCIYIQAKKRVGEDLSLTTREGHPQVFPGAGEARVPKGLSIGY